MFIPDGGHALAGRDALFRKVQVRIVIGRKHPVDSSCVRRKRGERGLRGDEHAFIRVAGPLTATRTAYYFVDNMATTGITLDAARAVLGCGDAIVDTAVGSAKQAAEQAHGRVDRALRTWAVGRCRFTFP